MSTTRCQVGDIAYIVSPYAFRPALGHVVTVERAAGKFERIGHWVYATDDGKPAWVCRGAVPDREGHFRTRLSIADECLLPINRPVDASNVEADVRAPQEVPA